MALPAFVGMVKYRFTCGNVLKFFGWMWSTLYPLREKTSFVLLFACWDIGMNVEIRAKRVRKITGGYQKRWSRRIGRHLKKKKKSYFSEQAWLFQLFDIPGMEQMGEIMDDCQDPAMNWDQILGIIAGHTVWNKMYLSLSLSLYTVHTVYIYNMCVWKY